MADLSTLNVCGISKVQGLRFGWTNPNLSYYTIYKTCKFRYSLPCLPHTNKFTHKHAHPRHTPSPSSCMFQSQQVWGVRCGRAACCPVWCLCGWSPENEWRPVQAPLLQCRSEPTPPGCHSYWSESPDLHQAWTPSPDRGTSHLETNSTAGWTEKTRWISFHLFLNSSYNWKPNSFFVRYIQ